ncbi:hypothetical protein [Paracoccus sp. NBH48]|uniref:hypothetical protein n=1 Tax=Paracoccus sp. NBH48 TaxID=2596918 RepID=UPI00351C67D8
MFGGTSTAHRNQVMTELLDSSFTRIPDRVREVRPQPPRLLVQATTRRAQVAASPAATQAEPQRLVLQASPPPATRPAAAASTLVAAAPKVDLTEALRLAGATAAPAAPPGVALASSQRPRARPGSAAPAADAIQQALATAVASDDAPAQQASLAAPVLAGSARPAPSPRRTASIAAVAQPEPAAAPAPEPQMQAAPRHPVAGQFQGAQATVRNRDPGRDGRRRPERTRGTGGRAPSPPTAAATGASAWAATPLRQRLTGCCCVWPCRTATCSARRAGTSPTPIAGSSRSSETSPRAMPNWPASGCKAGRSPARSSPTDDPVRLTCRPRPKRRGLFHMRMRQPARYADTSLALCYFQ